MNTVFYKRNLSDEVFINPKDVIREIEGFPEVCISTFAGAVMKRLLQMEKCEKIAALHSSGGNIPVYKFRYKEHELATYLSPVGASVCVANFEEIVAMGVKRMVLFGSCGILAKKADGKIIIPVSAVRDEGTSYFYKSPSDEVDMGEDSIYILENVMNSYGYEYIKGKVWTTDGVYRETKELVAERKSQGCIAVDMECSAMLAVSEYRKIPFIQFLFGADSLAGDSWDERDLSAQGADLAEQYIKIALECGINM